MWGVYDGWTGLLDSPPLCWGISNPDSLQCSFVGTFHLPNYTLPGLTISTILLRSTPLVLHPGLAVSIFTSSRHAPPARLDLLLPGPPHDE